MIALPQINFANLSKQEQQKLIGAGVAILLILAGSYFFLFASSWSRLRKLSGEVSQWGTKVKEAQKVMQQKEAILRAAQEASAKIKALPQWIPDGVDSSWMLRLVGEVGNSLNVRTAGIKPLDSKEMEREARDSTVKEGEFFKFSACQIDLKTDYHSLGKFIDQLERKNPYLKIGNMSLKPSPDDPANHTASFKIRYLIAKKSAAGATTATTTTTTATTVAAVTPAKTQAPAATPPKVVSIKAK